MLHRANTYPFLHERCGSAHLSHMVDTGRDFRSAFDVRSAENDASIRWRGKGPHLHVSTGMQTGTPESDWTFQSLLSQG